MRFVVIGRDAGGAEELRAAAGANVELRGFVSDDELHDAYGSAAVYVQASQHEGFGVSVAEAMLAGCVPVVTPAGALPEVVGDAGIVTPAGDLADAVRRALAAGPDGARRARERVSSAFPGAGPPGRARGARRARHDRPAATPARLTRALAAHPPAAGSCALRLIAGRNPHDPSPAAGPPGGLAPCVS